MMKIDFKQFSARCFTRFCRRDIFGSVGKLTSSPWENHSMFVDMAVSFVFSSLSSRRLENIFMVEYF
jgi:hypothetical protein